MLVQYDNLINKIKKRFKGCSDCVQLEFFIAENKASIFYLDGFVDKKVLEEHITLPLKKLTNIDKDFYHTLNMHTVMTTPIKKIKGYKLCVSNIESGDIVLIIESAEDIFVYSEKAFSIRSVVEPPVSNVLRGPREGFIEDIKTNITLIRKRLYTSKLKFKNLNVGRYSKTKVAIAYIDGISDLAIVKKIEEKIKNIDIDGIVESSYIARFLEENKYSLFPQVGASEKPDVVVGKMLEGRVAIIVDGSPSVLTLPFILFEHFQTAEDYYTKSFRATLVRVIRVIAAIMAVMLPGVYVAFLEYQYQMLPLRFLSAIIKSTSNIPLTPTLEMLVVLILFEILLEASIRMPRYIGMAIGVVGAIVLGDTAVSAGLLSSPTILIIAISTIGIYCVPDEANSISVLRLCFVIVGGVLGMFGIILLMMGILSYLASLSNYNSSYLAPFAPTIMHDWQDGVVKNEVFSLKERPYSISTNNRRRQK